MTIKKRLFDYLDEQLQQHPLDRAFGHKTDGKWIYYSTREMVDWVHSLCVRLHGLGLSKGERVATVVQQTTPAWVALDYAMLRMGIINVPMYPTISPREYAFILGESAARFCFTGDGGLWEKVKSAQTQTPTLEDVFYLDDSAWQPAAISTPIPEVEVLPRDIATIIYTSGTTGNPKGVVLSHENIVFNVETMRSLIPIVPGERGLSFLPVSHIFERAVIYAYTAYGASVSFTTPDQLGGEQGDLQAVRPHFFTAVPRLLEKVYERIYNKGLELRGLKRALFFWAMRLADNWDFDQQPTWWKRWQWELADRLIFSKWRAALGGCINGIVIGASACPVRIMRTFNAAGVRVREGYGMTEAAPAISFSRFEPGGAMLGSVGRVVDGVTVHIAPAENVHGEGEIWASGPGIMQGYYLQPEKTAEVIREKDGQRWLLTGDVGQWIRNEQGEQFLRITDRKKELLKTSGGKYVAPTPIESMFKEHRLVEQAMVVGDQLKFVSALIVPATDSLRDWCARHDISWTSLPEMIRHPKVQARYQMLIDRINPNFSQSEQIKKFALLATAWEPVKNDGSEAELTPTLKLKRRVITDKYQSEIRRMYE